MMMIDGKKVFEQKCQLLRFNLTRQHRLQVSVVMRQKYNIYTYSTYEGPYENGVNEKHELSSESIKCAIEIPITITFKSRD